MAAGATLGAPALPLGKWGPYLPVTGLSAQQAPGSCFPTMEEPMQRVWQLMSLTGMQVALGAWASPHMLHGLLQTSRKLQPLLPWLPPQPLPLPLPPPLWLPYRRSRARS
jgi:hypothetical protein